MDMPHENFSMCIVVPFRNFPKTKVYVGIFYLRVFKLPRKYLIAIINL